MASGDDVLARDEKTAHHRVSNPTVGVLMPIQNGTRTNAAMALLEPLLKQYTTRRNVEAKRTHDTKKAAGNTPKKLGKNKPSSGANCRHKTRLLSKDGDRKDIRVACPRCAHQNPCLGGYCFALLVTLLLVRSAGEDSIRTIATHTKSKQQKLQIEKETDDVSQNRTHMQL